MWTNIETKEEITRKDTMECLHCRNDSLFERGWRPCLTMWELEYCVWLDRFLPPGSGLIHSLFTDHFSPLAQGLRVRRPRLGESNINATGPLDYGWPHPTILSLQITGYICLIPHCNTRYTLHCRSVLCPFDFRWW